MSKKKNPTTKFLQQKGSAGKASGQNLKQSRLDKVCKCLKNVAHDMERGAVQIGREAVSEFIAKVKPVAIALARQALTTAAQRAGDYLTEKINNSTTPRRPATRHAP